MGPRQASVRAWGQVLQSRNRLSASLNYPRACPSDVILQDLINESVASIVVRLHVLFMFVSFLNSERDFRNEDITICIRVLFK